MNSDDSTKTHNTPKVEISVRNFGPIAEADLDLRPLTVFVGPSNTRQDLPLCSDLCAAPCL